MTINVYWAKEKPEEDKRNSGGTVIKNTSTPVSIFGSHCVHLSVLMYLLPTLDAAHLYIGVLKFAV